MTSNVPISFSCLSVPPWLRELIRTGLLCNAASRPLFVGKNGKSARETCQPLCDRTKREKCQPLFDPFFGQLVPGTFMCRAGRRTRCPSYMGRADVGLSRPAGRNGKSARHFSTFRSASDQVTPPNWLHAISPSTIAGVGLVRLDVTTKKNPLAIPGGTASGFMGFCGFTIRDRYEANAETKLRYCGFGASKVANGWPLAFHTRTVLSWPPPTISLPSPVGAAAYM